MWNSVIFALFVNMASASAYAAHASPTPGAPEPSSNIAATHEVALAMGGADSSAAEDRGACKQCCAYYCGPLRCNKSSCTNLGKFFCNPNLLRPTVRRLAGSLCYAGLYGGAAYAMHRFGIPDIASRMVSDTVATFIVLNGCETVLSCGALVCSNRRPVQTTPQNKKAEISIIIPVYGVTKDLKPTLDSIKAAGIRLDQVYIIENGTYTETSMVERLCASDEYSLVNYYRVKEWGSKAGGQVLAYALSKGRIGIVLDDDVILPPDWDPEIKLLEEENVGMIAYPIAPSNKENCLTFQQKAEYAGADRTLMAQYALTGSVERVHGAANAAKRDVYLGIIGRRPATGEFSGEDRRISMAMTRAGYTIAMASKPVLTEVPEDLATFTSQRITSWDLGKHLLGIETILDASCNWGRGCSREEVSRTLIRKVYEIQEMSGLAYDVVRPILMALLWNSPYFWIVTGALWEGKNLINIASDTCCEPYRNGEKVCDSKICLKSCLMHHMSAPFSILNTINGIVGACCAYVGAGAGRPQDYKLIETFPEELKRILQIPNKQERNSAIIAYAKRVAPDPRSPRVLAKRAAFLAQAQYEGPRLVQEIDPVGAPKEERTPNVDPDVDVVTSLPGDDDQASTVGVLGGIEAIVPHDDLSLAVPPSSRFHVVRAIPPTTHTPSTLLRFPRRAATDRANRHTSTTGVPGAEEESVAHDALAMPSTLRSPVRVVRDPSTSLRSSQNPSLLGSPRVPTGYYRPGRYYDESSRRAIGASGGAQQQSARADALVHHPRK